jgi:KaiC/GvpD/RAD55 family RecA-like ATPase
MDYAFNENRAQKLRTGMLGLDVQLGGGVPRGSTILLLAEPGASSEIFAQQFAYGGLTDEENVYYLTSEQPVSEITSEMKIFGWNIEDYIESGTMNFVDTYSLRFYNVLPKSYSESLSAKDFIKQDTDPMNLLKATATQERKEKYRGIIDSISYFLRAYELNNVVDTIEIISSVGKATGAVHLITMTAGMHDNIVENNLKNVCDGVIEFRMRKRGSEIERSILIRKMRGMIPLNRTIPYNATEKGIELETTTGALNN